jgi:hypothetical protein
MGLIGGEAAYITCGWAGTPDSIGSSTRIDGDNVLLAGWQCLAAAQLAFEGCPTLAFV